MRPPGNRTPPSAKTLFHNIESDGGGEVTGKTPGQRKTMIQCAGEV